MIALLCFFAIGISQTTYAGGKVKAKKIVKVVGKKNAGSAAGMKQGKPTTDKEMDKSRGDCSVYFNNYTGYYVDVYMDGTFWGTISPYGGMTVADGNGYTKIYCETSGGSFNWTASGGCEQPYEFDLTIADSN